MLTNNFKAIVNGLFVFSANTKVSVVGKNGDESVLTGDTCKCLRNLANCQVYVTGIVLGGVYLGSGETPVARSVWDIGADTDCTTAL